MKLISLNLEGHKHLDLQLPFFQAEQSDVLCLQEVFASDFERFKRELGMDGVFEVMCTKSYPDQESRQQESWGVAILAPHSLELLGAHYYFGDASRVQPYVIDTLETKEASTRYSLLMARVAGVTIGTTHFPWTPDGSASDSQRTAAERMLALLAAYPSVVFCGDFNAPRGGEIFAALAARYTDHVPLQYATSIDIALHRRGASGNLGDKMVDGLFSTPDIRIADVRLQNSVSDHMAIIATLHL